MNKALFASDLDNTLLFSHKYRTQDDICVEWLDGKEQGYMTPVSAANLAEINQTMLFVPVTSRSITQYERIKFPTGCIPRYALTTNGGVLLVDGKVDEAWRKLHVEAVQPWNGEMQRLHEELANTENLTSYRIVDELYLFAACINREEANTLAQRFSGETGLNVEASGRKVYFFPPPIEKGKAVQKLKAILNPGKTICAGDSTIDVPMLNAADIAIHPDTLVVKCNDELVCPQGIRFPDFVTEMALRQRK